MTATINQERSPKTIQRKVEALVGGALLNTVGKAAAKHTFRKSKLVAKEVYLPKCGYTMYYHEREAAAIIIDGDESKQDDVHNQQTIIFFHGLSMRSEELAGFITSLDIPPHIRILVPERMLESTSEFLDVVKCSGNTNAFGISLGGGVCYYMQHHRLLVSPAIL